MNLLLVLMPLLLQGGVIKESFRIAESEPRHHQVCLRAAMANDGRFAVTWRDSLQLIDHYETDLFVRFFDREGNPLREAYKIIKLVDTTDVYGPCLDMDTSGKTVLVWAEAGPSLVGMYIRFQAFNPDGSSMDSAQTLYPRGPARTLYSPGGWDRSFDVALANNGRFAFARPNNGVCVQRFDLEGVPKDSAFMVCRNDSLPEGLATYPGIALNDAGDLVVTWLHCIESARMYPRFQV